MFARAGALRRVLAAVGVAALSILLTAAVLGGSAAAAGGRWVHAGSAREAGAFWTPARMQAAEPLETRAPHSGVPREVRGRSAQAAAVRLPAGAEFGSDFEEVVDPTAPEFRIHGAIFVSFGIFGYGRCSGTAVRSPNRSVVVTAGHCVNSGGRDGQWFDERSVFVPAYRYGQRPFGVFPVHWIDATKQWRSGFTINTDVGAMVVGRNQAGELLEDAVGGAKIAWNLKPKQTFDVHGYPEEPPFDGETQRICRQTPFLGHDASSFLFSGPLNLAVACGLTGGASGGGWTIHGDTLNSVTNYGYFDQGSPVYGSYFGREVARLYGRAAAIR